MNKLRRVRYLSMAKARFTNRTNDIIKAKYVEKKTFKIGLLAFGCVSSLLLMATYRLYHLGDLNVLLKHFNNQITTYYTQLGHLIKGLF